MPFTADEMESRKVALKRKEREAEKKRRQKEAAERAGILLTKRLESEYGDQGLGIYDLAQLWYCAEQLTLQLVKQFTAGSSTLKAEQLEWNSLIHGRDYIQTEERDKRLAILTHMPLNIRNIGQTFTVEQVRDINLPKKDRKGSPQIRVICTAPIPV